MVCVHLSQDGVQGALSEIIAAVNKFIGEVFLSWFRFLGRLERFDCRPPACPRYLHCVRSTHSDNS